MGRSRFPPGVVVEDGAFLVSEFPPLFFAQGAVAGVYNRCCFPPGVLPSGDGATLDWIGVRRLKRSFRRKWATRGLLILRMINSSVMLFVGKFSLCAHILRVIRDC